MQRRITNKLILIAITAILTSPSYNDANARMHYHTAKLNCCLKTSPDTVVKQAVYRFKSNHVSAHYHDGDADARCGSGFKSCASSVGQDLGVHQSHQYKNPGLSGSCERN